jgi:hypothetical protein
VSPFDVEHDILALCSGHMACVERLLAQGASPAVRDGDGAGAYTRSLFSST